ncbi:MAG TPA: DegV family protein [Tenericutes bacterium]|nr:DegV family protein [Mycoplasmatota bacterium]
MKKIILSADSSCDLSKELIEKYEVNVFPAHINLKDKGYRDGVDITPDMIYETFYNEGVLPKTSAANPYEYIEYFKKWADEGYEVIHFNLGSALSSLYQNAHLAALELGNVYAIDSANLSTGSGMLVIEAAERIKKGMPIEQIIEEINNLKGKIQTSFIIDTLTFLKEGGRCSALAAFSANLLNIKPCILVDNTDGKMTVGKKYRGNLKKVLIQYTKEVLSRDDIDLRRIFITHSGTSDEIINTVKETVQEMHNFEEILVTRAGCTISSHCGPNTLGLIFRTK